jgi:hypothetical protein
MPIESLLVAYHNWLCRLIRPVPRSIHLSREFSTSPQRAKYAAALADIFDAIATGKDLTHRLSKLVRFGIVANSTSATKDKDLMLNDWGIHHLHLGMGPDKKDPSVTARSGDLLFAIFRPTAAYILNIFDHKDWTDRDIVRIAVENWPNLDLFLELKGVMALDRTVDEAEHQTLRKAGITSMVEVDGRVYAGRGMLSTAGTSIQSVRAADKLLERLENFEELCASSTSAVEKLLLQAGVQPPNAPHFVFQFLTDGYGVRETTTGAFIVLSDN